MPSPPSQRSYVKSTSSTNNGVVEYTTSSTQNIRRKVSPTNRSHASASSTESSVVSSDSSDSDSSPSPPASPQPPVASLHSRLRSFLPQLAAANASLAEEGSNDAGFELHAAEVNEDGDEAEAGEATKGKGESKELKGRPMVRNADQGVGESGDEDEVDDEGEEGMYIEMDLGLGVLETVQPNRDEMVTGSSNEPSNVGCNDEKESEGAVMNKLLGQKGPKKKRLVISEVE